MPSDAEIPVLLRKFDGVDIATDAAFIGPSFLQSSQNWIPDPTYLLTKRPGATLYRDLATDIGGTWSGIFGIKHVGSSDILYIVAKPSATPEAIYSSTSGGAFAAVASGAFTTSIAAPYGMATLGGNLYVGNGTDPIKQIPFAGAATNLIALPEFTDTTAAPGVTAKTQDSDSNLQSGLYTYRWGVYDSVLKKWTQIGKRTTGPNTFTLSGSEVGAITFTSPAAGDYTLGANELFHLFIAPVNLPIEFAHDHSPDGVAQATARVITRIRIDSDPVPQRGTTRTGRFLVPHRGRLWISGDNTSTTSKSFVYATSVIVPGLEQAIFDRGIFFPHNAAFSVSPNDGEPIRGIAVASASLTYDNPASPLLIFKDTSTWAWFGDIQDDDSAQLIQLSDHVGCVAGATICATPVGTIFCGYDSVYLIRPDTLVPIDIGHAIKPAIRTITSTFKQFACAVFHKDFYKLAIAPAGANQNTQEWWLDLSQGLQGDPSWWGPHQMPAYAVMASNVTGSTEYDRGFAGPQSGSGKVHVIHQTTTYSDLSASATPTAINSTLKTKSIDNSQPFQRKLYTRLRTNGRVESGATSVGVLVTTDGGETVSTISPLGFNTPVGATWDVSNWNGANWSMAGTFQESEAIFGADRPRGQYIEISLTHVDSVKLDLRDFELRYIPIQRPVGPGALP